MIIPIGVDCGMANFLKKYNLRTASFPFDWTVTYNGISKCVDDDFKLFTEPLHNRINEYDIYFHHDFQNEELFYEYKEKYNRRCRRLINILENSNEEIIFCRRGHATHHHREHQCKYYNIINDIDDAEKLKKVLSTKYPRLKYKIIIVLCCGECFNSSEKYNGSSNIIEIYNIASPKSDDERFEICCRNIFNV